MVLDSLTRIALIPFACQIGQQFLLGNIQTFTVLDLMASTLILNLPLSFNHYEIQDIDLKSKKKIYF